MKIYYEGKKRRKKNTKQVSNILPDYSNVVEFNKGTHLTIPTSSPDGTIGDISFTTANSTFNTGTTSGDTGGSAGMSTGGGMGESYKLTEGMFSPLPETVTKLNRICRILNCDRDNLVQVTLAEDTQNNPANRDDVEFIADLSDDILVYKYNDEFVISEEFDDTMVLYFQTKAIAEDYLNTKEEDLENTFKEGYNLKETDDSMNNYFTKKLREADYYNDFDNRYEEVRTKRVKDSDGFYTDYTMYWDNDDEKYIFVFGDKDIYTANPDNIDWECETGVEADEWFDNYNGFEDDEYYGEALTNRRHGRHLHEGADEPELKKIPPQKEQEEWRMLLALLDQEYVVIDSLENLATDKNLKLPKEAVDIITGMTSDYLNHIGKLQKFMHANYANGKQIQKSAEMNENYNKRRNYRHHRIGR